MKSMTQRIADAIEIDPDTKCWLWQHRLDNDGYGRIKVGGRAGVPAAAHRVSYAEHVGPIPAGFQIDHLCRARSCVNPDHLEPVTGRVNTMRSPIAPAAINARKTHCIAGHALVGSNLYTSTAGYRYCRSCRREATARWRAKPSSTP